MIRGYNHRNFVGNFEIDESSKAEIKAFIKGAVYCFCKNNSNERFSGSKLFGGDNRDWEGTPLEYICKYYENKEGTDVYRESAKALGWFLAEVLVEDVKREYRKYNDDWTAEYEYQTN